MSDRGSVLRVVVPADVFTSSLYSYFVATELLAPP